MIILLTSLNTEAHGFTAMRRSSKARSWRKKPVNMFSVSEKIFALIWADQFFTHISYGNQMNRLHSAHTYCSFICYVSALFSDILVRTVDLFPITNVLLNWIFMHIYIYSLQICYHAFPSGIRLHLRHFNPANDNCLSVFTRSTQYGRETTMSGLTMLRKGGDFPLQ